MNLRTLGIGVAVLVALVLQASLFSHLAVSGVVPDVVLLVVVATGLRYGAETGLATGFGAGLLLDLAPPADHVAGRWALALLVVGYVAGRLSTHRDPSLRHQWGQWLGAAAVGSFVGTSLFALSGLVLSDPAVGTGELLRTSAVALGYDLALALVVLPLCFTLFGRAEPDRVFA